MLCEGNNLISNRKVVSLLLRKAQNSKSLGDSSALPKNWNNYNRDDFEKLVRNLDIFNTGFVNFKILATCCILL